MPILVLVGAELLAARANPDSPPFPQETTIVAGKVAATFLRATPEFLRLEVLARLQCGDKLRALKHEGRWIKAPLPSAEALGLLHPSAASPARPLHLDEKFCNPEKGSVPVTQTLALEGFQKGRDAGCQLLDLEVLEHDVSPDAAASLRKEVPLSIEDERPVEYVNLIGLVLAETSDWVEVFRGHHFVVVQLNPGNAFSTQGGFLFVTGQAICQCDDEDEPTGLPTRAIAHVVLRHPELGLRKQAQLQKASHTEGLLGAVGNAVADDRIGDRVDPNVMAEALDKTIDAFVKFESPGDGRDRELQPAGWEPNSWPLLAMIRAPFRDTRTRTHTLIRRCGGTPSRRPFVPKPCRATATSAAWPGFWNSPQS